MSRWGRSKSGGSNAPRGFAKVEIGKTSLRVTFKEGGSYVIKKSNAPPYLKFDGKFYVRLNGDGDEIFYANPIRGMFKANAIEINAEEGKAPAPREYTREGKNQKGEHYKEEYVAFTAVFRIREGKFKGFRIPYFVRYKFDEGDDGVAMLYGYGKYTDQLDDFLDVTGVYDRGPMKFKTNLLPAIQKRFQKAKKEINIIMKNGFIDTLYGEDVIGDDEDDDEENVDWNEDDEEEDEFANDEKDETKDEDIDLDEDDDDEDDFGEDDIGEEDFDDDDWD